MAGPRDQPSADLLPPPEAFAPSALVAAAGSSFCEWKGAARYFDVRGGGKTAERAGWSYPHPSAGFEPIADHIALYAAAMDTCYVGDEQVTPQPGGFYGGWVTSSVAGPFKRVPGSGGW